jgi:hypothetical protein
MQYRVVVGRDVDVVREGAGDVELVGRVRLRPGYVVEIVPGVGGSRIQGGPAFVCSWRVRVLGRFGPIYRGVCRWFPSPGKGKTSETRTEAESPRETIG